jgi:hypothetical protein
MHPKEWAVMAWKWLHTVARAIAREQLHSEAHALGLVIVLLRDVLPCKLCRDNMATEITQLNDSKGRVHDFEGRILRGTFVSDPAQMECILHCLHNSINKRLGKPHFERSMLASTYNDIPLEHVDVALLQFLNAVVYVSVTDRLGREAQVLRFLRVVPRTYPPLWRMQSPLARALGSTLALTRTPPAQTSVAVVWRRVLEALGGEMALAKELFQVWMHVP